MWHGVYQGDMKKRRNRFFTEKRCRRDYRSSRKRPIPRWALSARFHVLGFPSLVIRCSARRCRPSLPGRDTFRSLQRGIFRSEELVFDLFFPMHSTGHQLQSWFAPTPMTSACNPGLLLPTSTPPILLRIQPPWLAASRSVIPNLSKNRGME